MSVQDARKETEAERADRNLTELLQELRVAGIGVQVLFGFLLAMPFSQRFVKLDHAQQQLYVACLLLTALSTALLLGPVAYHRLLFRQYQKEYLVRVANRMAIGGLVTICLAVSSSILLVVSFVSTGPVVVLIPTVMLCLFAVLWFAIPLSRHWRARRREP
jgi:hypothetical protein